MSARRSIRKRGGGPLRQAARRWSPRSPTSSSLPPRPRPRRCWRSRSSSSATGPSTTSGCGDDKSYPYIGISLDEDYPRIYFTRAPQARARLLRPVQQRQARPRDARPARQGLPVPHLRRPRAGPRQRQPLPRLLHQALPGALRRLHLQGGVPRQRRDDHRLPVGSLPPDRARARPGDEARPRSRSSSRRRCCATASRPSAACSSASASPTRPSARWTRSAWPPRRPTPTRRSSRFATACSRTGRASTSRTRRAARRGRGGRGIRAPVLRQRDRRAAAGDRAAQRRRHADVLADALAERRGAPVESGTPSAATSDASRSWPSATPGWRSTRTGCVWSCAAAAHRGARPPPARARGWTRSRCGSSASTSPTWMHAHTVASMVVFEGGAPKKSDYRRFGIRDAVQDDFAAMAEVLSRRMAQYVAPARAQPAREGLRRQLRLPARADRDRRRSRSALGGPQRAGPVPRPGRDRCQPRQADRGGVHAGQQRLLRPRPRHARAAAAPARPRRGPPVRDRVPPRPARRR